MENIDEIREKAKGGDAEAQFQLGSRYYRGEGVSKNLKNAVNWWRKAAGSGNAWAQHNLGVC